MLDIFNRSTIFKRRACINFNPSLYKKVEEEIAEELLDFMFLFKNNAQNVLTLNACSSFLQEELHKNTQSPPKITNLQFVEKDDENISMLQSFNKQNVVVAINALHNVNFLPKYLAAIKGVLGDGGIFCGNFFGTQNLSFMRQIIAKNDAKFSNKIYQRFNPTLAPEVLCSILKKEGFLNITVVPTSVSYSFNSFKSAMDFLKDINERVYIKNAANACPARKVFQENIPQKFVLDFDIIKFYTCA